MPDNIAYRAVRAPRELADALADVPRSGVEAPVVLLERATVVGLSVDQINRRFAAAGAAAGLEGRRTSHGGRGGLAVELTARGASTHAIQLAGGWKDPAQVVRYAASINTREGAVSKYLR